MEENRPLTFDEARGNVGTMHPRPSVGIAKTNPFMFDCNSAKDYNVTSIEDFIINYKRQDIYLGDFLRGNYKKWKKRNVVINAINSWIGEFDDEANVAKEVGESKKQMRPEIYRPLKIGTYISLSLCTLIIFFLRFGSIDLSIYGTSNFFINMLTAWQEVAGNEIGNYLLTFGVYFSVLAWMSVFIYRTVCNTFATITKRINKLQDKMNGSISLEFSKKAKNTLKYYKRMIRKNIISTSCPLPIEETGVSGYSFEDLRQLNEGYERSALRLKNKRSFLLLLRFSMLWATYLITIAVNFYGVIVAIINIFQKE